MTLVLDNVVVPDVWLRDACPCAECRDPGSGQRLRSVLAVDPDTAIVSSVRHGDDLEVTFAPDGHIGHYSVEWLANNAPGHAPIFDDRSERTRSPWLAAD